MLKEFQKILDASLVKTQESIEKNTTEKIEAVKKELANVKVELSAKEVSDGAKFSGISNEVKTIFGAFAKKINGVAISDELNEKVADFENGIEKAVIVGTDTTGQDLKHTQLHKGILALAGTYGVFVRNAKALTASEAIYKLVFEKTPGDNGDWIDEAGTISQDAISFGSRNVPMRTWRKMIGVSEQMLRNSSPADLGEYLVVALAKKFGLFIEEKGFDAVIASTGVVDVPLATGSTLSTLKYDHFVDIQSAVPSEVAGTSEWYMHTSVLGAARKIKDTAENPIFVSGNGKFTDGNARTAGTILDAPVNLSDKLPSVASLTTLGQTFALYGDLKEAFAVITRLNFRVETNNGGKYFEQGIVAVRGTADANIAELLPETMAKGTIIV